MKSFENGVNEDSLTKADRAICSVVDLDAEELASSFEVGDHVGCS